jgi:hypothetical protein
MELILAYIKAYYRDHPSYQTFLNRMKINQFKKLSRGEQK